MFISVADENDARYKVRELVNSMHLHIFTDNGGWNIYVSVGVALAPQNGSSFDCLYKHVDIAIYETKKGGKNNFTLYHC